MGRLRNFTVVQVDRSYNDYYVLNPVIDESVNQRVVENIESVCFQRGCQRENPRYFVAVSCKDYIVHGYNPLKYPGGGEVVSPPVNPNGYTVFNASP